MSASGLLAQLLNGLASASSLFLVSAGLSLIFGVMRIVNFAHGSFFMLGIYVAYSLVEHLGAAIGFWPALLLAPLATAALGALVALRHSDAAVMPRVMPSGQNGAHAVGVARRSGA